MNADRILQQLLDCESKVALQDELLSVMEAAFALIPTGQLQQGYTWIPSPEAVVIISLAKSRLAEHKELIRLLYES